MHTNVYARLTAPDTSLEAALKATGTRTRVNASRQAVYSAMSAAHPTPICDIEICNYVKGSIYAGRFSPDRLRHARLELERAGVVERTGDRVVMDGASRQTYKLTDVTITERDVLH